MATALGVDVGGTHIRVARVDAQGAVSGRLSEPVQRARPAFVAQLLRLVAAVRDSQTQGVGIGIPGRVDAAAGQILSAGYLEIAGVDLPRLLAEWTGLPARIENDATMAGLAEARGRPAELMLMVTVGTGIGGAVLQGGVPWYGGGGAGQFGHIVVAEDGPVCKCGRRGCVETFSSGTALGGLIAAAGLPSDLRAAELLARAEAGDAAAATLLARWAAPFRRALESLVAVVGPSRIVVGGGLGAPMVQALARLPAPDLWFDLPVEPARLGDEAGVIGAGLSGLALGRP